MTDTDLLLGLVNQFPAAFSDPDTQTTNPTPAATPETAKTQQLLSLATEFPEAFADPEAARPKPVATVTEPEATGSSALGSTATETAIAEVTAPAALPPGYATALQRRVSTYTWGQIDCYFSYGDAGLQQFWIVVGKSGTEVQSLCEGIARLVNLLLAQRVPVAEVAKQLRGMRGGTPEGLGPHQILGLVDLIGKVLQEAPAMAGTGVAAPVPVVATSQSLEVATPAVSAPVAAVVSEPVSTNGHSFDWQSLADYNHGAALCPECGAELHQVNGCSGGACTVCGYSSCS